MSKSLSFLGIGLLATCLTLWTPSVSQAQYYPSYGYRYSYGSYPAYRYGAYSGYRGYGYGGYGYDSYYYRRPTTVHPESWHWTPYRGLHTHGHYHVPHRGHYHIYRY
jgi:hypothetical protein